MVAFACNAVAWSVRWRWRGERLISLRLVFNKTHNDDSKSRAPTLTLAHSRSHHLILCVLSWPKPHKHNTYPFGLTVMLTKKSLSVRRLFRIKIYNLPARVRGRPRNFIYMNLFYFFIFFCAELLFIYLGPSGLPVRWLPALCRPNTKQWNGLERVRPQRH